MQSFLSPEYRREKTVNSQTFRALRIILNTLLSLRRQMGSDVTVIWCVIHEQERLLLEGGVSLNDVPLFRVPILFGSQGTVTRGTDTCCHQANRIVAAVRTLKNSEERYNLDRYSTLQKRIKSWPSLKAIERNPLFKARPTSDHRVLWSRRFAPWSYSSRPGANHPDRSCRPMRQTLQRYCKDKAFGFHDFSRHPSNMYL